MEKCNTIDFYRVWKLVNITDPAQTGACFVKPDKLLMIWWIMLAVGKTAPGVALILQIVLRPERTSQNTVRIISFVTKEFVALLLEILSYILAKLEFF